MTVVGTVEKIKGNTVVVRTKRPASCEHCPTASVCNKKEIRMNIPNTVDAKIGDTVRVYIEMTVRRSAFWRICFLRRS